MATSRTHYEAIQTYLAGNGWEHSPTHDPEDHDTALEIRTFLNTLLTTQPSDELVAGKRLRKKHRVSFNLTSEAPDSQSLQPVRRVLPSKRRKSNTSVYPITTTKVFPEETTITDPANTITVPWANRLAVTNWFSILTVVQDTIDNALNPCAPWTWLHSPVSPDTQAWYETHIYAIVSLSAKLSTLQLHSNFLLRNLTHTSTTLTAATDEATNLLPPNTTPACTSRPVTPSTVRKLSRLREAHKTLVETLYKILAHAEAMVLMNRAVKAELARITINLLATNHARPTTAAIPSAALAIAAKIPAMLAALGQVGKGLGKLVRGMARDLGYQLAAVEGVAGAMGEVLADAAAAAARHQNGDGYYDDSDERMVRAVEGWYAASWADVALLVEELSKGTMTIVDSQWVGREEEDLWGRVTVMVGVLRKADAACWRVCETMKGLELGVKAILGKAVRGVSDEAVKDL